MGFINGKYAKSVKFVFTVNNITYYIGVNIVVHIKKSENMFVRFEILHVFQ